MRLRVLAVMGRQEQAEITIKRMRLIYAMSKVYSLGILYRLILLVIKIGLSLRRLMEPTRVIMSISLSIRLLAIWSFISMMQQGQLT